jgi:hypothetical protein
MDYKDRSPILVVFGVVLLLVGMEALQGIPLQGFHLAVFFGIPLLLTLGVIIFSKRHFEGTHRTAQET